VIAAARSTAREFEEVTGVEAAVEEAPVYVPTDTAAEYLTEEVTQPAEIRNGS
jgi:hypothetical protein